MAKEAHDLSSTSGSFGAVGIMEQAMKLEILCHQGELAAALNLVRPLPDAGRALVRFIEQRYGTILPPDSV
ncbi:hypothetical protein CCP1ISM_7990001 [Azospirillaceae bacterium]